MLANILNVVRGLTALNIELEKPSRGFFVCLLVFENFPRERGEGAGGHSEKAVIYNVYIVF